MSLFAIHERKVCKMKQVELLAPAGNLEILKIAIQAGADAVYLAGKNFGARAFSQNFTNDELIEAVQYAHLHNTKVYVTVNTIIYNEEFNELESYIHFLYAIYVDALIIQDLGVLRWVRRHYPDFEIHASTQMNIYDQNGAILLQNSGVKRVVLARETPLHVAQEIAKTKMEVEVFIHGALCFSASGNCLMSYTIGKRSGNRGKCAQPCRKKYVLLEDGTPITKARAFLSMKDLNTISHIGEIIDAGITSLKIEGRMKSKEYVYAVVKSYREVIDGYYQTKKIVVPSYVQERLYVTFNREFTKGYLFYEANHLVTNIYHVNHQGFKIGKVVNATKHFVEILLTQELHITDAIRILGKDEIGFVVQKMYIHGVDAKHAQAGEVAKLFIQNHPIPIGAIVVKTKDSQIEKELEAALHQENRKTDVVAHLTIHYMEQPKLVLIQEDTNIVVVGKMITELSTKPIDSSFFRERLNKIKNTPFQFSEIVVDYDNQAYFSVQALNELRRNAIETLSEHILGSLRRTTIPYYTKMVAPKVSNVAIEAIVHNMEQYEVCKNLGIDNIYTDFESEQKQQNRLCNHSHKGLIQNLGGMRENVTTSSYFNVVNNEAVLFLMENGARTIYLSNELEIHQLDEFRRIAQYVDLGIMVYGRMDVMVTKHCLIGKAKGYSDKNCQECREHTYQLMDTYHNKMMLFPNPDEDCSLRILDYNIRDWCSQMKQLKQQHIRKFLLVFTIESKSEVEQIIKKYKKAL